MGWLATRVCQARFQSGEDIRREGEPGDAFYLIRSGTVAVLAGPSDGTQVQIASLGPGDPFGEQALLTGEPRSATVRALEPMEVFRLGKEDFELVLKQYRDRQDYFVRLVLQRQRPHRIDEWALERQVSRDGQGAFVLKDSLNKRYVRLSEQAAFLWELMDGHRTVRDLTLAYYARYHLLGLDAVLDAMMQTPRCHGSPGLDHGRPGRLRDPGPRRGRGCGGGQGSGDGARGLGVGCYWSAPEPRLRIDAWGPFS